MRKTENCPFKKGDILRNDWAGEENPIKYTMFVGCGTIKQGRFTTKSYDCIAYNGAKVQHLRHDHRLVKVGHIDEFDAFMSVLKKLKGWDGNESQDEKAGG